MKDDIKDFIDCIVENGGSNTSGNLLLFYYF